MVVRSITTFGRAALVATSALIVVPPAASAQDAAAQGPTVDAPPRESGAAAQATVVANPPAESQAPADGRGTGVEDPQPGRMDGDGQASVQPPALDERTPGRQAVDRFLRNPAGLLRRHPLAGQGLVNEVRLLAVTDVETVEEIIALSSRSGAATQEAIGRGLAAAALALVETDPETAARIQELVAQSGLSELQAAFLGRQNDVETFALGSPASAGGGGGAGDVGGGGSETGGEIGGSAGTGGTGSNLQSVTASGSGLDGGGTGFLAGLSPNGDGSDDDGNPATIIVSPTR
ncbi:hypothetical protein [Jiella pacifica]|uniref:Uncharacterized protein n=1 Tax=Jiella pacifica TaxID=2696469 RepID=A0A6N9SZ48_9HYPH|nr:hypothetical protein [Jiella pacifica]NDW04364.1 hypothetical protein [Jiella pacifica]